MKISYNWLKWYVSGMPEADKLADVFTYHLTEVESVETSPDGDTIFDLNILPNRAHDLLSHQGVAREIAGLLGLSFQDPTPKYKIPVSVPTKLQIDVQTKDCRRYMSRIVRGIKIEQSPDWVRKHLESIGQRSINNIVDATNIVMFDCGQPCHAFDLRSIVDEKITICNAKDGETLELVGKEKIVAKLKNSDVMISSGGTKLAVAGVKGGVASGIADDTVDIVLEVANFDPIAVRKTARRIGALSDAAKRFENDLSPTLCDFAMMELSALILEMFPSAQFEDVIDIELGEKQKEYEISFTNEDVVRMLGVQISLEETKNILQKYAFKYEQNGDIVTVKIPPLRLDLRIKNDIVEEIGRAIGYDTILPVMHHVDFAPQKNEIYENIRMAREQLLSLGYNETLTYEFCKKGKNELAYAATGADFLRTNLLDALKKAYEENRLNAPLLDFDEIKIFEIGNVFPEKDMEEIHVAYVDAKINEEMKLEDFVKKYNLGAEIFSAPENSVVNKKFQMWSLFPCITRDIAVWVPEGTDENILIQIFKDFSGELLIKEPRLFDRFTKENKTSLAFRLVFQSSIRTLKDDEVNTIVDNIYNTLKNKGFLPR